MSLAGNVCIVTGGAQGIGRAIAEALYVACARVELWDIDMAEAQRARNEMTESIGGSGEVHVQQVDVTRFESIKNAVDDVVGRFGRIDALVNNAGIYSIVSLDEETESDWDRALAVNLKSVFLCVKAVAPVMIGNRCGKIVNISSISGQKQSIFASPSYCASKAGVIGLTRYMAAHLAKHGINVNCVSPALTRTGMMAVLGEKRAQDAVATIPLGRMGEPEDIASAVLFLIGDGSSFITGETLSVNGGSLMR